MSHLGGSELPVLLAVVTGAMAFAFALVDYRVFRRSTLASKLLVTALFAGLFTLYHVVLVLDYGLDPTNPAFGGAVETTIAVVAVALFVERRRHGGVEGR